MSLPRLLALASVAFGAGAEGKAKAEYKPAPSPLMTKCHQTTQGQSVRSPGSPWVYL